LSNVADVTGAVQILDEPGRREQVVNRWRRVRIGGATLLGASLLLALETPAQAGGLNISGSWSAVYHCKKGWCAGEDFPQPTYVFTQTSGSKAISVNAGYTASLSGDVLTLDEVGGYSFTSHLTISDGGKAFSGPLADSAGTSGTMTGTRVAAGSTATTIAPATGGGPDVSGSWDGSVRVGGSSYPETITISSDVPASGSVTGTESGKGPSGSTLLQVTGTISASSVTLTESGTAYTAHLSGTVASTDGHLVASGTFTDSSGRHGSWSEAFTLPSAPTLPA
jgi:hypothetical protein